ncbi:MAG: nucleotidyltransferase family protein [Clostridia bacterium]|nr:nucleotidyltransferase family protein [Clostridia bacterium]
MDKKTVDVLFALLNFEMGFKALPEDFVSSIKQEDLKPLYLLAKKHDLAHIVGDALDKLGVFSEQCEAEKHFINARSIAIFRTETLIAELEVLCEELSKSNIDHIPLKGSVIRNMYPETWMRTSCDIDVLVKKEDLSRAISVLTDNLGYDCRSIGQHDAQIYSPTGVHIELHFSLQEAETEKIAGKYLDSVWEVATPKDTHTKQMPNGFFYTYIISHMIKHVKFGGCGIRAVMDLYLLGKNFGLECSRGDLESCGFLTFANAAEGLAGVWFGQGEKNELLAKLEEYILTGGVYGTFDNKISARQSRQKTKLGYFLRRLFIPFGELKQKYQILQKCALLYPFCLVARWFNAIFNKETKQRISKEVQKSNEVASCDNGIKSLLHDLKI